MDPESGRHLTVFTQANNGLPVGLHVGAIQAAIATPNGVQVQYGRSGVNGAVMLAMRGKDLVAGALEIIEQIDQAARAFHRETALQLFHPVLWDKIIADIAAAAQKTLMDQLAAHVAKVLPAALRDYVSESEKPLAPPSPRVRKTG